jgi:hypothetical protein
MRRPEADTACRAVASSGVLANATGRQDSRGGRSRCAPALPLKRGRAQTMTHDYKRNGTTDLIAALNVETGEVDAPERELPVPVRDDRRSSPSDRPRECFRGSSGEE